MEQVYLYTFIGLSAIYCNPLASYVLIMGHVMWTNCWFGHGVDEKNPEKFFFFFFT